MQRISPTRAAALAIALLGGAAHAACCQISPGEKVVREISDPSSGARWLLLRDAARPEGPGRLVPSAATPRPAAARESRERKVHPVIRSGDRLIVEESTAVAEARLEGVALGTAVAGSRLRVRLRIGGRIVQTVALAPGRAAFAPQEGARP